MKSEDIVSLLYGKHRRRFIHIQDFSDKHGINRSTIHGMRQLVPEIFRGNYIDEGFLEFVVDWKVEVYQLAHRLYFVLLEEGFDDKKQADFIMRTTKRSKLSWLKFLNSQLWRELEFGILELKFGDMIIEYVLCMARLAYLLRRRQNEKVCIDCSNGSGFVCGRQVLRRSGENC